MAIAVGSAVCAQSVPMSFRVSCLVRVPPTMVDTSSKRKGIIHFEVDGPTRPREFVPCAVGRRMYTDGEMLQGFVRLAVIPGRALRQPPVQVCDVGG